jgi:hypothetical protein
VHLGQFSKCHIPRISSHKEADSQLMLPGTCGGQVPPTPMVSTLFLLFLVGGNGSGHEADIELSAIMVNCACW